MAPVSKACLPDQFTFLHIVIAKNILREIKAGSSVRMGHLGQGAREGAGRRRDMMLQEERGRREAEAYFMAYIRGRVRRQRQ